MLTGTMASIKTVTISYFISLSHRINIVNCNGLTIAILMRKYNLL
jgi:hypothetical protein